MEVVLEFFLGFINKFLGQAPLLLGTVVFIGYALLEKNGMSLYQDSLKLM